jgi:hypothetical protein
MFPRIIDGKVYVPIMPSILENGMCIDGMREMLPDEDGYEEMREWIEANGE